MPELTSVWVCHTLAPFYGPLAQLVEQHTFNVRVAGSNPARLTIKPIPGAGR